MLIILLGSPDYDGDSKADISVYRANGRAWYRLNSSNSTFGARVFGGAGDVPLPSSVNLSSANVPD